MARTVRDEKLETRAAREKLAPRGKPYFRAIEPGLHLGYRKAKGRRGQRVAGAWVVRLYTGRQTYSVARIGPADDYMDADGVAVLSFRQAQDAARNKLLGHVPAEAGKAAGPVTVRDAITDYLAFLGRSRKSAPDTTYKANRFILPDLGDVKVAALTTKKIEEWLDAVVKTAPRHRTFDPTDPEAQRRRRSSANRLLTILRAALNRQFRDGRVHSDTAWRRVEAFEGADAARLRYLTMDECRRLINAAGPVLRPLVMAALYTGARYGELARLEVQDFIPDPGNLHIRISKSGKSRHVELTAEGRQFFREQCLGRLGHELIFKNLSGDAWGVAHQTKPMQDACARAKIAPPISFHGLRHTWASHAVMNGVPLLVVAKNLGHTDTRMAEKHYGHIAPSYVREAIQKGGPQFGLPIDSKVAGMTRPRRAP